jgi:uncharacterized protein involved in exopolysaccharide biosynthesis
MVIHRTARSLLNAIFRHRWRFVSVFCVVFGAGIAYCVYATPTFKSEALLLVKFNSRVTPDALPNGAIQAQASERKEVINSQARILHSRDLLLELVRELGVARIYPKMAEGSPAAGDIAERAAIRLDKDLEVEPMKDASVIELSLMNGDPSVAATALGLLIKRFKARQNEVFDNPQSTFVQDQLAQARRQLGISQAAVEEFKRRSGISSLEEERTLLLRTQAEARNSLAQQTARRDEAEGRLRALTEAVGKLTHTIQLSDENDRFQSLDEARARLTDLLAREKEMSVNYRDDSVGLQSLRAQIAFAQQELAARSRESLARVRTGPNPVYQQGQSDLVRAKAEAVAAASAMQPIEQQIADVERRLGDLDAKQGRLQDLSLQQQVDEENFRSVLQRSMDARASEDLQRQNITSIVVIQEPTVPIEQAKPRILLILAVSGFIGLAGALIACIVSELADETFSLPEQITAVANLPVLATFGTARRRPLRRAA